MKKHLVRIAIVLGVGAALLMIGPTTKPKPTVYASGGNGCRLTTLENVYGFSFSGYFNTGTPIPYTPLAAAGTFTFQPDGTIQRSFGLSFGGQPLMVNDSGVYSLNEDCTFSANFPKADETWNLIPVADGRQIEFFINTTSRVGAGTLTRQ